MVDQYYFKKIRNIFYKGLVYLWPYRIVRMVLAALYRDLVLIGVVTPYLYLSRRAREWVGHRNES